MKKGTGKGKDKAPARASDYAVMVVIGEKSFGIDFGAKREQANNFILNLRRQAETGDVFVADYWSISDQAKNNICINPRYFAGAFLVHKAEPPISGMVGR